MPTKAPQLQPAQPRFLDAASDPSPTARGISAVLVGIPYDAAVSYRGGASEGPSKLRAASDSIEDYCPLLDRELGSGGCVHIDAGDIPSGALQGPPGDVCDRVQSLLAATQARYADEPGNAPLLVFGGDHLVALPALRLAIRRFPGLQIIHIDAHGDLRQDWEGEPHSHATVIRRVLDELEAPAAIHRWGIRSGPRAEFELAREDPRLVSYSNDLRGGLELVARVLDSGAPIYLTFDVDGLDPADMPGTGTPEPGGLAFRDVEQALGQLVRGLMHSQGQRRFVGADLVELAPGLDPSGRSEVAAARIVRTLLIAFGADCEAVANARRTPAE